MKTYLLNVLLVDAKSRISCEFDERAARAVEPANGNPVCSFGDDLGRIGIK